MYRLAYAWARSTFLVVTRFRRVRLNLLLVPPVLLISSTYCLLCWLGEVLTHLRVPAVRRIEI